MVLDRILIVDDDPVSLDYLREILAGEGLQVDAATTGQEARDRYERERPDAVFTDCRMPGMSGLELLELLKRKDPQLPVVVVSAYGEVASVVRAIKEGAEDFLSKPFGPDEVRTLLARIEERCRLREENRHLRSEVRGTEDLGEIYRHSPSLAGLLESAERVAATKATVLIQGETGTGKELLARFLHERSDRRDGPYIRVNCAALSPSLLESEIFGHERGAFTGAVQRRVGRFELAHEGTILLDEVGEMPLELQSKLLRVLEEEEFERVGGQRTIRTDMRVIATTNRDLTRCVEEGTFRSDLFYRLNIVPLRLLPLRLRSNDVPSLVTYFLQKYRGQYRSRIARVPGETMKLFRSYSWPGNIRELRNVIQRIVVLDPGEELLPEHVSEWLLGCPSRADELRRVVGMSLAEVEKEIILRTLEETRQNKTEAARILGLTPRTLFNKLRTYKQQDAIAAPDKNRQTEESPGMNPMNQELEVLGKLLDVATLRHRVIAGNISNVNTPNYRRHEVKFEHLLTEALRSGGAEEVRKLDAKVVEDRGGQVKEDGNNVSLEREVGDLMKNTLYFETVSQLLSRKIAAVRSAISGRN